MASNFDFLQPRFPKLFEHATHAESLVYTAPRASCFYARFTLEQAVHWLYKNDPYLQLPYDNKLGALIHEQTFKDNLTLPACFKKCEPSMSWETSPFTNPPRSPKRNPST
jgi:type I restriction enzyme R subunit